jgi:predicted O-methyltransferase YrrM
MGYSTVSMASAAKEYGGKITTIDYDEQSAKQAIKNFKHAGVAELVEVIIGDAKEIIPTLTESFDLVFQDVGDKKLYPILLNNLVTLLKPAGVFLAEDSLLPAMDVNISKSEDFCRVQCIYSLEEFNKLIAHCPFLSSAILPIGDGLTIGIKLG